KFILDFYCPSVKLVIEVDGGIHDQQQEYDQARTEKLEAFGYRVLRFTNDQVMKDLSAVLETISKAARSAP
ncbi:MAG TPA: endonuclease domain-containing protein, partial [Candidatus Obscuribacterales bacterium]